MAEKSNLDKVPSWDNRQPRSRCSSVVWARLLSLYIFFHRLESDKEYICCTIFSTYLFLPHLPSGRYPRFLFGYLLYSRRFVSCSAFQMLPYVSGGANDQGLSQEVQGHLATGKILRIVIGVEVMVPTLAPASHCGTADSFLRMG